MGWVPKMRRISLPPPFPFLILSWGPPSLAAEGWLVVRKKTDHSSCQIRGKECVSVHMASRATGLLLGQVLPTTFSIIALQGAFSCAARLPSGALAPETGAGVVGVGTGSGPGL